MTSKVLYLVSISPFFAMGRMLGPIFSGMLFEWFVGAPFFSSAGLLLLASLVAMQLRPPKLSTESKVVTMGSVTVPNQSTVYRWGL